MKRILALTLALIMLIGMFTGCSNDSTTTPPSKATEATQPTTEPTQPPTEPAPTYKPGNWTTSGYTSEWLNLSYKPPLYLHIKSDSIDIDHQFYALKLKEDPYVAVSEMRFERSTDTSNYIQLYVKLLENDNKTAQQHAQSHIKESENSYKAYGADYEVLAEHNAEISFLGEEYFVQYIKYTAFGKIREECILFLVKDGYLVRIWYSGLSQYFVLEDTFSGFSALNGEDTSITCDGCSCDVNYQVLSTSTPVCLECYFTGAYTETENNATTPPVQAPNQADSLSLDEYLERLNNYADKFNFRGVSNLTKTQIDGQPNSYTYSCDYVEDTIHLNIAAENNMVRHIFATTSPYTFIDLGACSDIDSAKVSALEFALCPAVVINENWDHEWHATQFLNASEDGSNTAVNRSYKSGNWTFTIVYSDAIVSVSALYNNTSTTPNQLEETTPQTTPAQIPTQKPTQAPTQTPTQKPTQTPTQKPTQTPTQKPTQAPTQAPCSHTYKDATCTAPKTCTKCGATSGSALPHTWKEATCTTPKTCSVCGTTTGSANGHMWKDATCTTPKTCSVCNTTTGNVIAHTWKDATCTTPATCTTCKKTSGKAKGHIMDATVCENCDYTDFSAFASTFPDSEVVTWEHLIEAGYEPTNVSLNKNGVFTFTCLGETYSITLKQTYSDHYSDSADFEFDCYQNGVLLTDAEARMCVFEAGFGVNETPEFTLHLSWDYFEGETLYFSVDGCLDSLPYVP